MTSSTPNITQPTRGLAARAWVWLLVMALMGSQWLGLMHRVLHTPQGPSTPVAVQLALASDATAPSLTSAPAGVLAHFGVPTKSDPDCRLYDQLGLSEVLTAATLLWVPALLTQALPGAARCTLAATSLDLHARGPPLNS